MADDFKKLARSNERWCRHDTNTTSRNGCKNCWLSIKLQQRRLARKRLKGIIQTIESDDLSHSK